MRMSFVPVPVVVVVFESFAALLAAAGLVVAAGIR